MQIEKIKLLEMYVKMRTIREFEEKIGVFFAAGKIPGFVHLCVGQEAVPVGVCESLRDDDYITSTHRGHGHVIAKGANVRHMMAELFGKIDGHCNGKAGSMHICDFDIGVLGANGIVGGGLPIAVGAAFSAQYRGTDQVCVCFFGDGTSNQGTFHESLNLAAVKNLPAIFVCENNGWSEFTSRADSMRIEDVSARAASYGIPGETADGTDVVTVYEACKKAVNRARNDGGPTLLEFKTFRWHGHYEGDPQNYREEKEIEHAHAQDPIAQVEERLLKDKLVNKAEIEQAKETVTKEIEAAIEFAEKSPLTDFENETNKVYA